MPSRKAQFACTCEQMQCAEKFDRLSRQGHGMGNAHFHAAASGRHNPERLVQINPGSPAAAKLGTPQGQIGQNLEGITDNGSALVFVYAAQEMGSVMVAWCFVWIGLRTSLRPSAGLKTI